MALFGCSDFISKYLLKIDKVGPGSITEISSDEAIVFGRLILRDTGVDEAPYRRLDEPIFGLFHVETERRTRGAAVENNGYFYWKIPTGTYLVSAVNYGYQVVPQAAFQVPHGARAYYIGTLEIDQDFKVAPDGVRYVIKKNIRVIDEFEHTSKEFRYRVPGFRGRVDTSLMVVDKRLPKDPSLKNREELAVPLTLMKMPPLLK